MACDKSVLHKDLADILAEAQVPALPQSAIRLLELCRNSDRDPTEFAIPIEADPGLTGQVLKFVNSSYFGFVREVSSVRLAIKLVGVRTIKNFALWNAVFSLIPNPKCGPFDLKALWQDSLRRGLFARTLARYRGLSNVEEVFTAALLQDMAVPLLAKGMPKVYGEILTSRVDTQNRLSGVERKLLGWTHGDAGAMLARQWNLPEEIAWMIESHWDVEGRVAEREADPGAWIVALSALLPSTVDPVWRDFRLLDESYSAACKDDSPGLVELIKRTDHEFADFAPMLRLGMPRKSLFEEHQEAVAVV